MARPRDKKSKASLDGLGLEPEEDKVLLRLINEADISIAQLKRALIRKWIADGGGTGIIQQQT